MVANVIQSNRQVSHVISYKDTENNSLAHAYHIGVIWRIYLSIIKSFPIYGSEKRVIPYFFLNDKNKRKIREVPFLGH